MKGWDEAMKNTDKKTISAVQELEWFREVLLGKGASENTVRVYLASVRRFYESHEEVTVEALQAYKKEPLKECRPSTVNTRIYGMNQYVKALRHCRKECQETVFDPPNAACTVPADFKLPAVKRQQKPFLNNVISKRDYEKLKRGLRKDQDLFWYFVVRFLGATGARVSELVQIKAEHIAVGCMDLYSKGGKIRRIYFPETLCEEMAAWLNQRGMVSGYVFTNRRGKPISPRGISAQLKVLAKRYRIRPETVYPHSFRHRYAKNFLSRFNDISLLADLMGHDSIETTRVYLTRSSQEQQAVIDRVVTW